ncbi:MAG: hypothetical protein JWN78_102 [Bacteroidota bacterium]|nr:hypothetical protein [Bacteroidota bacterium]
MKKIFLLIFSFYCLQNCYCQKGKRYFEEGNDKFSVNDFKGAMSAYNRAIEINPKYLDAYNNRGKLNVYLQNYLEALSDFNKTIEIDSNYKSGYQNRGVLKSKLKDYQGAIDDYNKAINIDSTLYVTYFSRGQSKFYLKDYQGAIVDYTKSLEINPNYAADYFDRGLVRVTIGGTEKDKGCLDLYKAKTLGIVKDALILIQKYCK